MTNLKTAQCTLVQSHRFVAKVHQNAPSRVLHFKNVPRITPRTPILGVLPQTPVRRGMEGGEEGEQREWKGGDGRRGEKEGKDV